MGWILRLDLHDREGKVEFVHVKCQNEINMEEKEKENLNQTNLVSILFVEFEVEV